MEENPALSAIELVVMLGYQIQLEVPIICKVIIGWT